MDYANLQMLIELATTSREAAARQLASMRQQLAHAQAQQLALQGYIREYANRAQQHSQHGIDPAAQANWRAFDVDRKSVV